MEVTFTLNGATVQADVRADEPLLDALRRMGVKGCRLSCGVGVCGACTATVDGDLIATCIFPAPMAAGRDVRTIEGVDRDDPVARAFVEHHAVQCGYCTPGMVLTAANLLADERCSDAEARDGMSGNLCRCGCYLKISAAVEAAAEHFPHRRAMRPSPNDVDQSLVTGRDESGD